MKRLGGACLAAVLVFGAVAPAAAHRGGRIHFGPVVVGAPILAPLLFPLAVAATIATGVVTAIAAPFTPPYAAPVYRPPVYVAPPPAPAPAYWYYCPDARAYYPYVAACPGGWLTVVPR
jgi:hypothetical protein